MEKPFELAALWPPRNENNNVIGVGTPKEPDEYRPLETLKEAFRLLADGKATVMVVRHSGKSPRAPQFKVLVMENRPRERVEKDEVPF